MFHDNAYRNALSGDMLTTQQENAYNFVQKIQKEHTETQQHKNAYEYALIFGGHRTVQRFAWTIVHYIQTEHKPIKII